jgi:hypothetical protein
MCGGYIQTSVPPLTVLSEVHSTEPRRALTFFSDFYCRQLSRENIMKLKFQLGVKGSYGGGDAIGQSGSHLVGGFLFVGFFVGIFDFRLSNRHFSVDNLVVFVLLGSSRYPLGDADLGANSFSLFPSLLWLKICNKR